MWEREVSDQDIEAVTHGIEEILELAGVKQALEIKKKGYWFKEPIIVGEEQKYESTKWYIDLGRRKSNKPNQLNAGVIANAFLMNDETGTDFYDVLVTNQDLYTKGTSFIVGIAQRRFAAVLSPARFSHLSSFWRMQCLITETIHEVGHIFNIPSSSSPNTEESLGTHCTNECTMKQGLKVPYDWIEMSKIRTNKPALCQQCREDLRRYFDTYPRVVKKRRTG